MKTYNNRERLARNYTLMTDEYEISMANGYLASKKGDGEAVFDIFFRKVPNNGGYAVMAGLDQVIPYLENLKFDERDLDYLKRKGYSEDFIKFVKDFKFTGDLFAVPDGTPIFPNEPIITVKAPLSQAQIVETALLSIVNGAISHATGARRIVEAVPNGVKVLEFGARRADGMEAAIDSSIYGLMAGCDGTSNALAADMVGEIALGTMAHSWVERFDTEFEAFKTYAEIYPNNCILLVDTYDTLRSGIPNAIKVFKYMKENNMNISNIGIRIDSGDLAYLSKMARKMLDESGFPQATICISNGLTAETIESLVKEKAPFDSIGVGDNISKPEGNVGCVYKLVAVYENGKLIPKIKVSNSSIKTINPDFKNLYRMYDKQTGFALGDVMTRKDETINKAEIEIFSLTNMAKSSIITNFELEELQKPIFENGELVYWDPTLRQKKAYCADQMSKLYPEIKRTNKPSEYYVDGTEEYAKFKDEMISDIKKKVLKM